MPCWCQSSDSLLTWFVPVILQRTLNLFHFPMFYLNLSEIMEHGKRPPISWLSLLSNLQAQTELHSVMWPFALPVLSKLWPHPPRVVSDEEISAMISAGLAMVWKHRYSIKKKKKETEKHTMSWFCLKSFSTLVLMLIHLWQILFSQMTFVQSGYRKCQPEKKKILH